jgi:hypothetical protein
MAVSLISKNAATLSQISRSTNANVEPLERGGGSWDYNEDEMTYSGATDPDTGLAVFYNNLGAEVSLSLISRN